MPSGDATSLAIAPFDSVSRIGGVGDCSLWRSLSDHPQLLLIGEPLCDGQAATLFELDFLPIVGCEGEPSLCFDFGAGFDHDDRVLLRPSPLSAKLFSAVVGLAARPVRIRLDPCMASGEFLCSEARVSVVPLAHVLAAGEVPVRMPRSAVVSENEISDAPDPESPRESLLAPPRIGVVLHLFYEALWPELAEYVGRIPSLERLYISIQESASRDVEGRIATKFPDALVRRLPNRGRDVLPFLQWLEIAGHEGIELICKIHTKRSPHVPEGDAWRRDMLDKLLGSQHAIDDIVSSFRADPTLGIVGPGGHLVPASFHWERNADQVEALCARMGFDVKGVSFEYVAGSMFWAKTQALLPLRRLDMRVSDFEEEAGLLDGTMAHALERCFPIAARVAGYRVAESANAAGTTVRDFAP